MGRVLAHQTDLASLVVTAFTDGTAHMARDDAAPRAVSAREALGAGTSVANPLLEEPDAVIPHVRICGGPGEQSPGLPDSARADLAAGDARDGRCLGDVRGTALRVA